MIRRSVLALVVVVLVAAPARASDPADELRDALARLPALQAADLQRTEIATFVDVAAVLAWTAGDRDRLRREIGRLVARLDLINRLQYAAHAGDTQWIGTDLANLRSVIGWDTGGAEGNGSGGDT